MQRLMRIGAWPVFAVSVAVYLGLSFGGMRYGLPDKEHTLSYVADETKWIEWLSLINPKTGRYNPHPECHDPTLYLWMYGGTVFTAYKLGWLPIHQSKEWFLEHPEVFARFYLVGRYLQILFGLGMLFFFWRTALSLYGERAAMFGVFLLAISPALVSTSNFNQASLPVAFLGFVAVACLAVGAKKEDKRAWLYAASVLSGLAMSTKYSALALAAPLAFFVLYYRIPVKTAVLAVLLLIFAFLLGSPFAVLAPESFMEAFRYQAKHNQTPFSHWLENFTFPFQIAFPYALGTALSWFSCGVVVYFLARKKIPGEWVLLVWIIGFYLMMVRVGMMSTSPRILIVLPAMILLVGRFFDEIGKKSVSWRAASVIVYVILVFFTARSTLALVKFRRTPVIQKTSSQWVKDNIPRDKTIAVTRRIYWHTPEVVYQSFHHPERRVNPYKVIALDMSMHKLMQHKPDYVVAPDIEKFRCEFWNEEPTCREMFNYLDSGAEYEVVKRFPREVGIFGWTWDRPETARYPMLDDDDLKATALTIYKRKEPNDASRQ